VEALQLADVVEGLAAAAALTGFHLACAGEAGYAGDGYAEPGRVDGHPGALELGDGVGDGPAIGAHALACWPRADGISPRMIESLSPSATCWAVLVRRRTRFSTGFTGSL